MSGRDEPMRNFVIVVMNKIADALFGGSSPELGEPNLSLVKELF